MKEMKTCAGTILAGLLGWFLLLPPFSVTPAGKTYVNTKASLATWEVFSKHETAAECQKHRDDLRTELKKATASGKSKKGKQVFVTLKERAAAAVCISSTDRRLRPEPTPTPAPHSEGKSRK